MILIEKKNEEMLPKSNRAAWLYKILNVLICLAALLFYSLVYLFIPFYTLVRIEPGCLKVL